jgi:maltooligosyltrehalose trehalohydrolase
MGMSDQPSPSQRRLSIGAEILPDRSIHFRVWAPRRNVVEVTFDDAQPLRLDSERNGYFSGATKHAKAGTRYRVRLDSEGGRHFPDPASRFQPDGPHGPSVVVDPSAFRWTDPDWKGVSPAGQVLYEMHIGTFTPEGTWASAQGQLSALKEVGITCLEVMPVCEFPGKFGWGYDGVDLFAPTRLYGTPDDMRRFVDAAHAIGIGVILDVVYNHVGPDGNYLKEFGPYFTDKHRNDWGESINFDDKNSGGVREFYLANARYWIEEFHLDGFRFDATQAIVDDSPEHILSQISRAAREAGRGKGIYLVNENEPQHTKLVRPCDGGGCGMDALWNDDFHHSAMVVLAGHSEAYYSDHRGKAQEFISATKWGYLFQGQRYAWQKKRRGTPALDLPPTVFVNFIQNHDQVANSARGLRAHHLASPGHLRAMTALLLLSPQTPMLFQGQEWAASNTFHYFAEHNAELAKLVRTGRRKELSQFPSIATQQITEQLLDPANEQTFRRSVLNPTEREKPGHAEVLALHTDLLRLRREEPVFRRVQRRGDLDGAVLAPDAFVLRYFGDGDHTGGNDRLLLVNFGTDLSLVPAPEPLLGPPLDRRWAVQWSSEDLKYGGLGTPAPETEEEGWLLPGRSAIVMKPVQVSAGEVKTRVWKAD